MFSVDVRIIHSGFVWFVDFFFSQQNGVHMYIRNHSLQNKRKSSRYSVTDSSAVMLSLINVISYHVLDMSKSGLSFCYNGKDNKIEGSNLVMTFFSDRSRSIDIPIQVIYDTDLNIKHLPYQFETGDFQNPYLRRCGVKFDKLSLDQEETIKLYLQYLGWSQFNCVNFSEA